MKRFVATMATALVGLALAGCEDAARDVTNTVRRAADEGIRDTTRGALDSAKSSAVDAYDDFSNKKDDRQGEQAKGNEFSVDDDK